ncbi:hypothetical protein [Candidatus Trichorickettsia mobilis]|uniref:hypothetical protein n=1 Tax=Candidatus Trichorickettsia mobilis TaxID=1346319 RepID=UPI00293148FE|nr:hypothetical protein [Candidatus Trichorickettsia mobilis]
MEAPGAIEEWNKAFSNVLNKPSFDAFKRDFEMFERDKTHKFLLFTEEQAWVLFDQARKSRLARIEKSYGADWHELRGNERQAIEILFYNCEGLVCNGTKFKHYLHNYIYTKDKTYLLAVVDQVKNHSNKDNDPRIQIHRNVCATLINSTESPFYVPPGHPLLPLKSVKVVFGKTVIPLDFSQYSSLFPINRHL